MAVVLDDNEAAWRRCNNQIEVTAVVGGNIGRPRLMVAMEATGV